MLFRSRATAATVGDASLSTAELGYYYHVARNRFNSTMSMFGGSGLDNSKSDAEQMYNQEENKSCRDYFLESALTTVQQELALSAEAKKNGHTEAEAKGPKSSIGFPRASMIRPRRNSPTGIFRRFLVLRTKLPAEIPLIFS